MLLLALQSGLRSWDVGSDTLQYYLIFENSRLSSWEELTYNFFNFIGKDPFYSLFQKIFQLFTLDYQWYLLFVALVFMSALGHFIIKNTTQIRHALLALVFYMGNFYGFFSITGIRQTLATALLLWSYEFIKQRKLFHFTVLVGCAGLFHISALVFFPLYFIATFRRPKLIFTLSLIGLPLIFIFKNEIAVFFVNFVDSGERFGAYAEQYHRGGSLVLTVLHIVLAIWALLVFRNALSLAPATALMFNTFALAMFFFPLQWVNPSAGRIAQYFTLIMMVWVPYLLDASSLGDPKKRVFIYGFVILLFISFTFVAIKDDNYKFFWQDMSHYTK